jgi:hypothetical protein
MGVWKGDVFASTKDELLASLIQDLHPDDRGPHGTHHGAIIANGTLYCPATPRPLLELGPLARNATPDQTTAHDQQTRCGHPTCACHADPPRRHGPYWQWTRKVAAKTICRWLSPEQQHDYQTWISNDRRLHELIGQLETLGAAALEADPRLHRNGRSHPDQPG